MVVGAWNGLDHGCLSSEVNRSDLGAVTRSVLPAKRQGRTERSVPITAQVALVRLRDLGPRPELRLFIVCGRMYENFVLLTDH